MTDDVRNKLACRVTSHDSGTETADWQVGFQKLSHTPQLR